MSSNHVPPRGLTSGAAPISHQSADWWVIAFAICLVVRWDSPSVPVRPIVAIQAWGGVAVAVARSATVPAVTTTGRAASYRVFATRSGTVLRYRQGTSTRQQYCRHHDAFKEGHVVSPTRRRTHRTGNVVCDTRPVIPHFHIAPRNGTATTSYKSTAAGSGGRAWRCCSQQL